MNLFFLFVRSRRLFLLNFSFFKQGEKIIHPFCGVPSLFHFEGPDSNSFFHVLKTSGVQILCVWVVTLVFCRSFVVLFIKSSSVYSIVVFVFSSPQLYSLVYQLVVY